MGGAGNQCAACGQWAGRRHRCPTPKPSRTGNVGDVPRRAGVRSAVRRWISRDEVNTRVDRARDVIAVGSEEHITGGVPDRVPADRIPRGPFTLPDGRQVEHFFHGSVGEFEVGDVIVGGARGVRDTTTDYTDDRFAYATANLDAAQYYAVMAQASMPPSAAARLALRNDPASPSGGSAGPRERVYKVVPLRGFEVDPAVDDNGDDRGNFDGDMRSQTGWVVVGEVRDGLDFDAWR